MTKRKDPLRGFRFQVEIEGMSSGGFSRVKGLQREIKHESFKEGGVNDYEHKLISQVSHPNVTLERGFASDDLWQWAFKTSQGMVQRKTVWIRVMNEAGQRAWSWQLDSALPVKWSSTDIDALSSGVTMESLELAHHGLSKAP